MKDYFNQSVKDLKEFERTATLTDALAKFKADATSATQELKNPSTMFKQKAGEQGGVSHIQDDHISQIGEIDLELKLRMDVTEIEINRLFK
jgi:ribosomal protein L9